MRQRYENESHSQLFRLPAHNLYGKIKEAHRKYGSEGKIYFYFTDDTRLREIKNETDE